MSEATLDTSALDELDGLDPEASSETTADDETPDVSADATGGSPDAEPAATDGPARDEHGRFAPKEPAAATAQPEGQKIEPAAEAAQQPEWKPYTLKVKGQETPLDGVSMTVQDGHVVLAAPETAFPRVRDLMQRGRLYEEREAEFIARDRALKERENAPRVASPEEIEAKVVLDYLKPHLASLLSEADLAWLTDKVKLATLEAQSKAAQATQEYTAKQEEEGQLGQFREGQLAAWMDDLAKSADFAGKLTDAELKEFFEDLQPYAAQFIQEVKPGAPLAERFRFRNDLLAQEFAKRVRRASLQRTTATKVADATRFNAAQTKPAAAAAPAKRVVTTPAKPQPKATGRESFDKAFKEWSKRPDLSFGDEDDE